MGAPRPVGGSVLRADRLPGPAATLPCSPVGLVAFAQRLNFLSQSTAHGVH